MNFEWTFYPLINLQHHALVIWKVLVHWIVQIFQMLTHSILPNQKITNSSTNLFRRVFKIRKLQNSTAVNMFSKILIYIWKLKFYWQQIWPICFPLNDRLICFIFEKISAKDSNHCLSVRYSFKLNWCTMKKAASSASNLIPGVIFHKTAVILWCPAEVFGIYIPFCCTEH